MAWKQILKPNLDNDPNNPLYIWVGGTVLTDWCGWCLAVVAGSYGAKGSSYSAKTAWQSCGTKHYDKNIPEGVYVPLWYGGGEYGHVVIGYREGDSLTVYSSPYTHTATFVRFQGEINWLLDYVGQVYGVGNFSGWSETVLESRVIEVKTETKPTPKPDPQPEPEPEPEPEPTPDPEPIEDDNNGKDDNMDTSEPTKPVDQQIIGGIIEEAGENSEWTPSKTAKLVAYICGDVLLVLGLLTPTVISAIEAPNLAVFGEYLAKILLELGVCILMIFKLIKKK